MYAHWCGCIHVLYTNARSCAVHLRRCMTLNKKILKDQPKKKKSSDICSILTHLTIIFFSSFGSVKKDEPILFIDRVCARARSFRHICPLFRIYFYIFGRFAFWFGCVVCASKNIVPQTYIHHCVWYFIMFFFFAIYLLYIWKIKYFIRYTPGGFTLDALIRES